MPDRTRDRIWRTYPPTVHVTHRKRTTKNKAQHGYSRAPSYTRFKTHPPRVRVSIDAKSRLHSTPCPHCNGSGFTPPHLDPKALLEALAVYTSPFTFNTQNLIKLAQTNAPLLRLIIGDIDARRLGLVLHRISILGDFGGLSVERQGRDKTGTLWRVYIAKKAV